MNKKVNELEDELHPEYDFSQMAGGVRCDDTIALLLLN
jgi:hypothetical protein